MFRIYVDTGLTETTAQTHTRRLTKKRLPTNTLITNFRPPTHAPRESFVISYAQKIEGDLMSVEEATASSHVRSVITSDRGLHPFPLFRIHSLKLLFRLCKCPTWTKEGSTATQGDNKKIHNNSSQGRGEKGEIYIPINQSINYTT